MNREVRKKTIYVLFGLAVITAPSCNKEKSQTTGWKYNDTKNGGFEKNPYVQQETGPGLILIEGGTFVMGRTEQDVMYDWTSIPRRVTVSSFYMDETEIRNVDYREYLHWISRVYVSFPQVYKKALPDTLVWRSKLGYNEPYVEYYFRHPAYQEYPVVGVSWLQANDYCSWRTDRVNEAIMIREGILKWDPTGQTDENNFNTDAYFAGQYEGAVKNQIKSIVPGQDTRRVKMEDGIMLPSYRLPTEAEWEYAALGLIGNTQSENISDRRLYPWNGSQVRNPNKKHRGEMMANFKRGRGDNMGVAGNLNDNADITAPVKQYWPNDYGLYNMAGNVSEWVMDVYRPLSLEDNDDFRAFRGNVFKTKVTDAEGNIAEKDSLGRLKYRNVTEEEALNRRNYRKADNINYRDGDLESSIYYADESFKGGGKDQKEGEELVKTEKKDDNKLMYEFGVTSLINNRARVYKGGSWKDRAYWMVPGTRRFLDESLSTDYIGFRCAMARVGSPVGLGTKRK